MVGRASTASGARMASSGNALRPEVAVRHLGADLLDATDAVEAGERERRPRRQGSVPTGRAAPTIDGACGCRRTSWLDPRPRTRSRRTRPPHPISVYTIAERTAAVSSSDAGPKNRTAANASNPPTTMSHGNCAGCTAGDAEARATTATGPSTAAGATHAVVRASPIPSPNRGASSDDSNPTSRTGAIVPATTAVDAPAWRTTAFNGSPSMTPRFLIDSSTSTVCRRASAIALNSSASTAASCRLMPVGIRPHLPFDDPERLGFADVVGRGQQHRRRRIGRIVAAPIGRTREARTSTTIPDGSAPAGRCRRRERPLPRQLAVVVVR